MILIGITGTIGSGKGTVVDYLVEKRGFTHYAVRDYLTQEIERRGMPVDRTSMRAVANELRAQHEPAYVVKKLYEQSVRDGKERIIIESVRNIGEAEFLKSKGAFLLAVDADQRIRYERVQSRRSPTDQVDFETFMHHEEREMKPEGPHDMNVRGVMALADATVLNNTTLEELFVHVEGVCKTLPTAFQ